MAILGDIDPDSLNAQDLAESNFDRFMAVPGVYDTQRGLEGMRGLVAIRRKLSVTPHTGDLYVVGD